MIVRHALVLFVVAGAVAGTVSCSSGADAAKSHVATGDRYLAEQKYQEAVVEYRNALREDERLVEARVKLAEAYEHANDHPNALKERVRVADLQPESDEAQLAAARRLVLAGQFEDARTRLERVLARDAGNVQAQVMLGSALVGLRDLDGGIREIEAAVALDPLEGQTYASLGVLQLAKGNVTRAEEAFAEAVRLQPHAIEPRVSMASLHLLAGRPQDAERTLLGALEIDEHSEPVNRALAALYVRTGRPDRAEPHLVRLAEQIGDPRSKLALADYYSSTRRWDDATALLTAMQQDPQTAAEATLRLAVIAYADRRGSEAHRLVDGLIESGIGAGQGHLLKGRFLLAENNPPRAIEHLRKAAEADPRSAASRYVLGNAHLAVGDLAAAAEAFRATVAIDGRAVQAHLQLSRVSLLRGDAPGAVQAAEQALQVQPNNPVARLMLADGLMAARDVARAEAEVAALKSQYPSHATVHVLDGKLQSVKQDWRAAHRAFGRALEIDRSSFDAVLGLVNVELATGEVASAQRRVQALLQATPDGPGVRMLAARVLIAAGDARAAEVVLRSVLQREPGNVSAHGMLGELYLSERRFEEAVRAFDAITSVEPDSATAHTMAAMALHAQGLIDRAQLRYERVLELNPDSPLAANNLAAILAGKNLELDRALRLATRAAAQRPGDPQIQDTIGWIYYRQQLPSLAVPAFERALKGLPESPTIHYRLGLSHAAAGDQQAARRHLERALAISPSFDGADDARAALARLGTL